MSRKIFSKIESSEMVAKYFYQYSIIMVLLNYSLISSSKVSSTMKGFYIK